MSGWDTVPLGDVAESVDYGVTASAIQTPIGPKFLRITDIQDGYVNWDAVPWCELEARSVSDAQLQPGDIVFARTGATTGKSFLVRECPNDAVFASYLIRVRLRETADPRFVSRFFETPDYWAQITKSARGVAQPGVNATTLKTLKIPLPPQSEQRRIAEILDKADALRAKRRAALAQLDTLPQAMFVDMFGDPATNAKRWTESRLGDVISNGPQNGLYKPANDYGSGSPILRIDGFYDGGVTKLANLKRVRISEKEQAVYGLAAGQIVINRVNSREYLGKSAIIPPLNEPTVFESNLMRFDVSRDVLDPVFLIQYLQTQFVRVHIQRSAKDAINQSSINQHDVKAIPVIVPPLSL